MLQTNTKEHYLMVHRTKYEGALKEGSILKVDITKEMLFNMKQSLRFAKAAAAENKELQTTEEKCREERELVKKLRIFKFRAGNKGQSSDNDRQE